MNRVIAATVCFGLVGCSTQPEPAPSPSKDLSDVASSPDQSEALRARIRELEAEKQAADRKASAERNRIERSASRMRWLAGRWTTQADGSGCNLVTNYTADGNWSNDDQRGTYTIDDSNIVETPTWVKPAEYIDPALRKALFQKVVRQYVKVDEATMKTKLEGRGWVIVYKC